jgi:hypothetical protein
MANYYTQFCFGVALHTPEEKAWWEATETSYHECSPDCPEGCDKQSDDDCNGSGIDITFDETGVIIVSEEGGNADWAAGTVQEFLSEFKRDDVVTFAWACTCSRMMADAFGGGAYAISRLRTHGIGTFTLEVQYAAELLAELKAAK